VAGVAVLERRPVDRDQAQAPSTPLVRRLGRGVRARVVPVAAVLVVVAAVTVRLMYLGSQSYWNDEVFSVNQARQDLPGVFGVGATEVHTPLYAVLLHAWISWGHSTITLWTHTLSAVFGLLAVAASWTALRGTRATARARWVAVAVTASSGFGIVYAQETRPYALALLGATGITGATAGIVAALLDRRRPRWHWWLLWAVVAATAHLLGAVLVGIAAVVVAATALAVRRPWQALAAAGAVVPALWLQLAWLVLHGRNQPGFADGTRWIGAPGPQDVAHLVTSVFASGDLTTTTGGYVWASGSGTAVAAALLVAALLLRFLPSALAGRRAQRAVEPAEPSGSEAGGVTPAAAPLFAAGAARDGVLGLVLLLVTALTVAVTYVTAQDVHIWTLRNMIVVVPALSWAVAWVVCALPRPGWAKDAAALAVLAAAGASLLPVAADLDRPYKTDLRSAILYLARMRTEHPAATYSFFGPGPVNSLVAADRDPADPELGRIFATVDPHPRPDWAINRLHRLPGPQAVLFYTGPTGQRDDEVAARILTQLADPSCARVPLRGIVLVACHDESDLREAGGQPTDTSKGAG
jgi:hypothetical protein